MNPTIDTDACTGCDWCVRDCPYGVLSLQDGVAVADPDRYCCACGHCVAVCPPDAVTLPDRPAAAPLPPLPAPEAVEALMAARRSVRFFRDEPVSREEIDRLLAAAALAPSGCNARAASVTVIVDPFLLKAIRTNTERSAKMGRVTSHPAFVRLLRWAPVAALRRVVAPEVVDATRSFQDGAADHRDWVTQGAPALLLFHARTDRPTPGEDCCIAADHVTLLAPTLGLGTCWNGIVVEVMNALPWLRWRARLPREERVYAALTVGHPAIRHRRSASRGPMNVRYV